MRQPESPLSEVERDLAPREHVDEPNRARTVTFTIAILVTIVFLLVTAVGITRLLSDDAPQAVPGTETTDEAAEGTAGEDAESGEDARGQDTPAPSGTVSDPGAGLAFALPGEGWQRLGDDQVPPEYSSYTVYGPLEDPEAIIVTGSEELGPLEPLGLTAVDMATDMVERLATDDGDLWIEPDGATEVDGRSAFGATMGAGSGAGDDSYGRFVVVELGGDQGGFMLGLNTGGGAEATEGIDAAFASVGTL
ncbi:hypothetical protein [Nocardiopsis sp. MG754419]|uniref:hypothetical protein n=1 Tax=Nocardiopsis sp. MG754419 TaxID=2259865 RepID=UPI001BA6036E|nr:hypothetical protein [Nocardiopsis sp. MG754419]MBR8741683.1 hypothetical protein [Nocardiopsis sp. MG754419]